MCGIQSKKGFTVMPRLIPSMQLFLIVCLYLTISACSTEEQVTVSSTVDKDGASADSLDQEGIEREDDRLGTGNIRVGSHIADIAVSNCMGIIGREIATNLYSVILNIDGYHSTAEDSNGNEALSDARIHIEGSNPENNFGATFTYTPQQSDGNDAGWNTLIGRDDLASMTLILDGKSFNPVAGAPLDIDSGDALAISIDMPEFMITKSGDVHSEAQTASFQYEGVCNIRLNEG